MCTEVQQAMNTKLWHLEENLHAINLQQLYQLTIEKRKHIMVFVLSAVLIIKPFCVDELLQLLVVNSQAGHDKVSSTVSPV